MREEEIIEILKDFTENENTAYCYDWQGFDYKTILPTIKGLLDLQKQEKEKNKKLQIRCKELIEEKQELNTALLYDNINKDKIKDMQRYREFELQQKYKDFENDSEWKTYNKILEEN